MVLEIVVIFPDYSAKSAEEIDVSGSAAVAFLNVLSRPCDGTKSNSRLVDVEPQPDLAERGPLTESATRHQS